MVVREKKILDFASLLDTYVFLREYFWSCDPFDNIGWESIDKPIVKFDTYFTSSYICFVIFHFMCALNRRRNKLKQKFCVATHWLYMSWISVFFCLLCACSTLAIWVALLDVIEFLIKLIWADIRTTSKHCHLIPRVREPFVILKFQLYDAKEDYSYVWAKILSKVTQFWKDSNVLFREPFKNYLADFFR